MARCGCDEMWDTGTPEDEAQKERERDWSVVRMGGAHPLDLGPPVMGRGRGDNFAYPFLSMHNSSPAQ
jgi:hypothetical protein